MPVKDLLPLVDADILAFESCYAGQFIDEETEELQILPFRLVINKIEEKVRDIMTTLGTRLEPIMFLSGEGNFRESIAKKKGYKANRDDSNKPYHLTNATVYITSRFNTYTSQGCEADDLLCISQTDSLKRTGFDPDVAETVICTRDKDLRQCQGWHYGWECGSQPEFKLQWVDELGTLTPTYSKKILKSGKPSTALDKLAGTGLKWFYAQLLIGDTTDNIPGLKGTGNKGAFNLLDHLEYELDMRDTCVEAYKKVYGDMWEVELMEQAHLVWMVRERDENGGLKWWEIPNDQS